MGRREELRTALEALPREQWSAYLTEHSGLPGPRGNIELGEAFADLAEPDLVAQLLDSGDEYLTFCGTLGLGGQLAEQPSADIEDRLRRLASDERWRVREAVAMALQRLGDADLDRLCVLVTDWAADADPLVQRAAAAGICEPRLLQEPDIAAVAVDVCEQATSALAARPLDQRRGPGVRALRKGLGYCWSVAVAADPSAGVPRFQSLTDHPDPDVAWIVRENLKKARLLRALEAPAG